MLGRLLVLVALSSALLFLGPSASPAAPLLATIASPPSLAAPLSTGTTASASHDEPELASRLERELMHQRIAALDRGLSRLSERPNGRMQQSGHGDQDHNGSDARGIDVVHHAYSR